MHNISLLTIVRGRRRHLENLLLGVSRLAIRPREVVVVFMNESVPADLPNPGCRLRTATLRDPDHQLPLAKARNRAAALACCERLVFLDVDCIPGPGFLPAMVRPLLRSEALVMGNPFYLPAGAAASGWTFRSLETKGAVHPRRPQPPAFGHERTDRYELFWSLAFAVRKSTFARMGGFDPSFVGYGGEDTDFAFTAREAGVPFYLADARCYHQHHTTCTPPYNHFDDIVTNARAFHAKWDKWPMEGWLDAFAAEGYLRREANDLVVLNRPTAKTILMAQSETAFA